VDWDREYRALAATVKDRVGLEAIRSLHQQLDDDHDGTIEPSETGDFIKADLQVVQGALGLGGAGPLIDSREVVTFNQISLLRVLALTGPPLITVHAAWGTGHCTLLAVKALTH
jgi:hypothetical protein